MQPLSRRSGVWFAPVDLSEAVVDSIPGTLVGVCPAPVSRIQGGQIPSVEELSRFRPSLFSRTGRNNPVWIEPHEPAAMPSEFAAMAGVTRSPTAAIHVAYDPNLLSAVHSASTEVWTLATVLPEVATDSWSASDRLAGSGVGSFSSALPMAGTGRDQWLEADQAMGSGADRWLEASGAVESVRESWQQAPRVESTTQSVWNEAQSQQASILDGFKDLPRIDIRLQSQWQDGRLESHRVTKIFSDGLRIEGTLKDVWQQGGYPDNNTPIGPVIPPPIKPPWGTRLRLCAALPGTSLHLRKTPCVLIAETEIATRKTYMSINSASLVRWPDLTQLPCTSMSIETNFDSWCWGLTATLIGKEAWNLVQPNPLACEVLATINGQSWKFLLDEPNRSSAFNSNGVSLKGRSRSAWLHSPFAASRNQSEPDDARDMTQLAESAVQNTGWTIDWQIPGWLVPAGRYNSHNTPIGALIRLANTTDDGLYSDPTAQILTVYPKWPVASWLIDGATAVLSIPDAAVISLAQNPVYTQPLNGVYVSGTSHGVLALVKIAGTDGALQPSEPITNELLCDTAGVAARQRGINALSDSGAGYELTADLLFAETGLIRPGLIVSIAGIKGVTRSIKVSASWGGDALQVRQSIGFERREIEA